MIDIVPQLIVNSLITGSIYALAASGLALVYGVLRVLNFAHGHLMMTGAYFFFLFSVQMELPLPLAILATACASLLLGYVTLLIFIRPFQRFHPILMFLTSLCLANALEALVSISFGVNVRSLAPGSIGDSIEWGPVYITPLQLGIIIGTIVLLSGLALLVHRTNFGLRVRPVSDNPEAGEALGYSMERASLEIVLLSTLLASLAGILVGMETNIQPTMGNAYTVKAFAAMVLGGLGNIWGTVVGSYLLGFVENFAIGLDFGGYSLPAGYRDAFAFIIILVMLLIRPQGLFGSAGRKV